MRNLYGRFGFEVSVLAALAMPLSGCWSSGENRIGNETYQGGIDANQTKPTDTDKYFIKSVEPKSADVENHDENCRQPVHVEMEVLGHGSIVLQEEFYTSVRESMILRGLGGDIGRVDLICKDDQTWLYYQEKGILCRYAKGNLIDRIDFSKGRFLKRVEDQEGVLGRQLTEEEMYDAASKFIGMKNNAICGQDLYAIIVTGEDCDCSSIKPETVDNRELRRLFHLEKWEDIHVWKEGEKDDPERGIVRRFIEDSKSGKEDGKYERVSILMK